MSLNWIHFHSILSAANAARARSCSNWLWGLVPLFSGGKKLGFHTCAEFFPTLDSCPAFWILREHPLLSLRCCQWLNPRVTNLNDSLGIKLYQNIPTIRSTRPPFVTELELQYPHESPQQSVLWATHTRSVLLQRGALCSKPLLSAINIPAIQGQRDCFDISCNISSSQIKHVGPGRLSPWINTRQGSKQTAGRVPQNKSVWLWQASKQLVDTK